MTSFLSDRVLSMSESETLAMARLGNELKDKGVNVINMGLGEPDFKTPNRIKEKAKKAIDENFTSYSPVVGYKDLLEAIVKKFKRDNGLDYKTSQIMTSTGAKQCIANICMALINPGDEVVIPAPYWVSYKEVAKFAGGEVKEVLAGVEQDFKITPQQLDEALNEKTKLFIFSNPSNPTGGTYTKEELSGLAKVFEKYPNVYILSDEIYEYINFGTETVSMASFDSLFERVITVNGVSKAFAMTGWRLGYIGAAEKIVKACSKIQGQFTSGTCTITQKAAIQALEMDVSDDEVKNMVTTFNRRRDLIVELVGNLPEITCNKPQGAFYLFPKVSAYFGKSFKGEKINNAKDFAMYLLNEAHIAATPGGAFGAPEYIRFSYATSDENIKEAVQRMESALKELT